MENQKCKYLYRNKFGPLVGAKYTHKKRDFQFFQSAN